MTWPAGEQVAAPVRRSRVSLRARLIGLVVLTTLIALLVLDLTLPRIVGAAMIDARDKSLAATLDSLPDDAPDELGKVAVTTALRSGVGWTLVSPAGKALVRLKPATGEQGPALPSVLPETAFTTTGVVDSHSYRTLARASFDQAGTYQGAVVVWTSIDDIDNVLDKIALGELLITVGLLLLLGVAASLLIRRELKPLEEMADVADSIAAGDLSKRVAVNESGVEVDRLGVAFNGMLDGINGLLADRHAAEHRLRQFVADASHELRTPVAAVRGYTDLYAAGALPEPPAVGRAMERMGFESRRMGSLVEDLLTLVQADTPGALVKEEVDLLDLLGGAVEDAAAIDGSRHWRLAVPPEAGPIRVFGDRNRLHQLFANLLGNIRTHTPAGSSATVGIEPDPDPRFVIVTVADNGTGVEEADLPYLFDRFYRADPSRSREHGGSGLGLAIVAAIAGAHGGAVSAAEAVGGGLMIRVRLPRS